MEESDNRRMLLGGWRELELIEMPGERRRVRIQ